MNDYIVACSGVIPDMSGLLRTGRFYETRLPSQQPKQVVCQEQRLTENNRPSVFKVYDE